jgi:hypothetical protein
VEQGVYNLSNYQFVIGTGQVNRTSSTLLNGTQKISSQYFTLPFPTNCIGSSDCFYPPSLPLAGLAAIATIQSLTTDGYLLLRVSRLRRKDIEIVLTPHDSLDSSYFDFPFETAAYMVFETGITIACLEGLAFETRIFTSITSDALPFSFSYEYSTPPGVFGLILTQNSVTDSTALRCFNRNTSFAYVITQEDSCDGSNPIHTTPETAGLLLVGQLSQTGETTCDLIYNVPTDTPTSAPSGTPTSAPTIEPCFDLLIWDLFGDGWQNMQLSIVSAAGVFVRQLTVNCSCYYEHICLPLGVEVNITIEPINPHLPVRQSWEAFFQFSGFGYDYSGSFGSVLRINSAGDILYTRNLIDSANVTKREDCEHCPRPPPPPPPPQNNNHGKEPNGRKSAPVEKGSITPRPPLLYPFVLSDEGGHGWYNGTNSTHEICEDNYNSSFAVPKVSSSLTYPRYFITNGARTDVIHSGSLCGQGASHEQACVEVLPYDGHFVWRVAGISEDPSHTSWDFCGVQGTLGQELQFQMKKGACYPIGVHTSGDYCAGIMTTVIFSGTVELTGSSLITVTSQEVKVLQLTLSQMLYKADVKVVSQELEDGYLTVGVTASIHLEKYGFTGTNMDEVFEFEELFETTLESIPDLFVSEVNQIASSTVSLTTGSLSRVSGATFDFEFESLLFEQINTGEPTINNVDWNDHKESHTTTERTQSGASFSTWMMESSLLALVFVLLGGVIGVVVVKRFSSAAANRIRTAQLPTALRDSEHGLIDDWSHGQSDMLDHEEDNYLQLVRPRQSFRPRH